MPREPKSVVKLRNWLYNDSPDWMGTWVADPVAKAICFVCGHEAIDDQCGIPAHQFCWRCNKSMPNAVKNA